MNKGNRKGLALREFFPSATPEQWKEEADKLLKGKPFEKVMVRETPEKIRIDPLYWKSALDALPSSSTLPGFDGYLRGTRASGYRTAPWDIAQEFPYGTPEEFNRAALEGLKGGQSALNILLDIATMKGLDPDSAKTGEVGACGLSLANLADMETAFRDLLPEAVRIHIRSGINGLPLGALLFTWLEEKGTDLNGVRGSLGMDPLEMQAANGVLPVPLEKLIDEMVVLAQYCTENAPSMRSVSVSMLPYHQAGASAVEELGIALATGVYYLQALTEACMPINAAAGQIRFSLGTGSHFFMEIAKFRAIRPLWARVVEAFGGDEEAQKIQLHARTGIYNKTRRDPYVNILRTTTEALSAVIGGVDSLCVGTFDEVVGLPGSLSRRLARNTQIILQEECELCAAIDPAGGSWAVESLTAEISEKAWEYFQEIERAGGVLKSLKSGIIQERISATTDENKQKLNHRRTSLVGTNIFPNLDERETQSTISDYEKIRDRRAREVADARIGLDEAGDASVMNSLAGLQNSEQKSILPALMEAVRAGATLGEMTRVLRSSAPIGSSIQPLPDKRLASHYETLRDASAAFAKKTGRAPTLFSCNLGPLHRHKARSDFTRGFFGAGGFEILSPAGFGQPDEAVAALAESGAQVTVICGTDEDYADRFTAFARAIKASNPEIKILLAGHPGERESEFRAAGMDDFFNIKSDHYHVNRETLEGLGVL